MKKLLLITFMALFALISKAQYFDYQVKGWQLQVDTTYSKGDLPEETGTRYWDEDDLTTSLVLPNGVVLQDGHELFFDVLNQTGDTLENGRVAAYAGDVGASGKIKAIYGIANYTLMHPKYILGIVTHDILNGDQGKITFFGKVRGIQTNGANYGETWSDGEVLYVSSSVTGYLTKVQPNAPYPAIPIAVVVKAHATMGTLLVRPTFPTRMQDLADVNGTPLTTKGQIPVWNQAEEFFDFNYNIWPDLISNEGYGSSWDGVDSIAPSKNAVYDKIQSLIISGVATNLSYTASSTDGKVNSDTGTDATIPAGSTTNASLMLPADKTKLDGVATQADNYNGWMLGTGTSYRVVNNTDYINFTPGLNVTITDNEIGGTWATPRRITISAASMVYPGAGLAKSTGSGWATSITDNSANWNTAYGWGNHAGLYTPLAHKTTEDALNGLVKVNGAGSYSAITDNSTNWNTAVTNMGKSLINGEASYYNLSETYFMNEFSLIRPKFGTATYANLLPVTGGEVYSKLILKQDAITLTTTGTSGAATFDGTTLNIPQYSSGGTNYWQSGTGYIAPATITDEVRVGSTSDLGDYKLQVTGNSKLNGQLAVDWTSGGSTYALYTTSNSNLSAGYFRNSSTGGALYASSYSAIPAVIEVSNPSVDNSIETILELQRLNNGTPGTGAGARLSFKHEGSSGSTVQFASIASKSTTVTAGSESGSLIFSTVNAGSMSQKASLDKDGIFEAVEFKVSALNTAPASSTATGTTGEIRITSGYIYVCTATNTWVRAALATW